MPQIGLRVEPAGIIGVERRPCRLTDSVVGGFALVSTGLFLPLDRRRQRDLPSQATRHGNDTQRVMTPLQFMNRLVALIPTYHPLLRYFEVFGPHAAWRKDQRASCHYMPPRVFGFSVEFQCYHEVAMVMFDTTRSVVLAPSSIHNIMRSLGNRCERHQV